MNAEHEFSCKDAHVLRDRKRSHLSGFARFLHSTDKLTRATEHAFPASHIDDAQDLPVPDRSTLSHRQNGKPAETLPFAERNRRALRVHIGPDVKAGLSKLANW